MIQSVAKRGLRLRKALTLYLVCFAFFSVLHTTFGAVNISRRKKYTSTNSTDTAKVGYEKECLVAFVGHK